MALSLLHNPRNRHDYVSDRHDWMVRLVPRRILVAVSALLFTCIAFTVATGTIWDRHTDMERITTPVFCVIFLIILLASIRLPDQHLHLVTTALKVAGGAILLAGIVDGLALFDPTAEEAENHLIFYVCWLPVYHAAIFYVSTRERALRWSLRFLAIFTLTVLVLSYVGPLPLHHDNVVILYFALFPQLAGILIVHFISVFREDLATERTRIRVLQDTASALQQESENAERARQQAEASDRAKSIFLANMGHELRTPLNAILGFSQMMESGVRGPLNETYQAYSGDIRTSAEHLLSQINSILEVSRIDLGADTMREEAVDVNQLIVSCIRLVQQRAVENEVSIEWDAGSAPLAVRADADKLKQVITNILTNAVKFNHPGGTVSIAAEVEAEGGIIIQVRDTGIGMTEAETVEALELFHQSDNGFIRRYEGVGLGLSIARSLVELHDGSIAIESTPGDGTTVKITLPSSRHIGGTTDDSGVTDTAAPTICAKTG